MFNTSISFVCGGRSPGDSVVAAIYPKSLRDWRSLTVCAAAVMSLLFVTPSFARDADPAIAWEDLRSPEGTLRRATFLVADAACGFHVMADPRTMGTLLRHVNKLVVHSIEGSFQDVSVHERFFLVGNVESRYHRVVNDSNRVEWTLVAGRQARHDGIWVVKPLENGAAEVTFENLIKAKYGIHQGLLRRIQERTMSDVVDAVRERCGKGETLPPTRSNPSRENLAEMDAPEGKINEGGEEGTEAAGTQSR
jgi:hypothetical protein